MGRTGGGVPVAVKPKVIEPAGGMVELKEVPVTVMDAPDWAKLAFQPLVSCWPLGHVQLSDHAAGVVPVLVSVISTAKPPGQTAVTR